MLENQKIYDFDDYRKFLQHWLQAKGKHGILGKWAKAMNISSTLVSFVMSGKKDFTLEQASDLSDYLNLNEQESEYFLLLLEIARAGTEAYRNKLLKKKVLIQNKMNQITAKVGPHQELTDEIKGVFYSSWMYSGVRILSAIPQFQEPVTIARHLNLPTDTVAKVLGFLVENKLCKQEGGKFTYGPSKTHVNMHSPHVTKHHQNWRLRGTAAMELRDENDFFYTGPMAISADVAKEIRGLLLAHVEKVVKIAGPSDSEEAHCLNIDWFRY